MSMTNAVEKPSSTALPPPNSARTGIRKVLVSSGIPEGWFSKRPRLPSRNWLIFLTVTSSIAGYYYYDRRECKRIREKYVDRVKYLAEEPAGSMEWPRMVTVYASKWPGDHDHERGLKYFRKYVKPIFVAAAVDFETINGKTLGMIAHKVADKIIAERRLASGLDRIPQLPMQIPTYKGPEERRLHELLGGIVLIGRPAFKEFMAGLKLGWSSSLEKVDREEVLAHELQKDGAFDEEEPSPDESERAEGKPVSSPTPTLSPVYSPLREVRFQRNARVHPQEHVPVDPPSSIPPQPPILFVSFTSYIGFTQIPFMVWEFFNRRHHVQAGAEAAYRLIIKCTRPFIPPPAHDFEPSPGVKSSLNRTDTDFDKDVESYYKRSLSSTESDIETERKKYYEDLPSKLKVARDLARGSRKPTKDEVHNPPPTEVELQADRLKKEVNWRNDLEGWNIIRPEAEVVWDDRFRDALSVFVDPP